MRLGSMMALTIALGCVGCTTPADVSKPLSEAPDRNAKVVVKDTPTGFSVDVSYSRYQFVPETGALLTACTSIALAKAREEAKSRGREIQALTDQDVRVSTGRNIINARTSCRAYTEAKWKS